MCVMNKGIVVKHKKYGSGRLIYFDPLLHMIIDFSKNGKRDYMMISTTKEHLNEVVLRGGVELLKVVDMQDPLWYPHWRLHMKTVCL